MGDEEKMFGFDPKDIGLRYRAHQVLTEIDEDWPYIPVGSLVVRARDGASNPIHIEAIQLPNFIGTLEDDFDSTYRYYFYKPLEAKMTDDEWKSAAMADAQKVCELTALTTELADALEGVIAVSDRKTAEYDKAKAALKKVGR